MVLSTYRNLPSKAKFFLFLLIASFFVCTPILWFLFAEKSLLFFTQALSLGFLTLFILMFCYWMMVSVKNALLWSSTQGHKWNSAQAFNLQSLYSKEQTLWFAKIMGAQCILIFFFYAFVYTSIHIIPYQITVGEITQPWAILQDLSFTFALHPWPLIAILSAGLSYTFYVKKNLPLLSSLLPNLKNDTRNIFVKRALHILINSAIQFAIILALAMSVLSFTFILLQAFHIPLIYGWNAFISILMLLMMQVCFSKKFNSLLKYFHKKNYSLGKLLLLMIMFLSLVLILFNCFVNYFKNLNLFQIIQNFTPQNNLLQNKLNPTLLLTGDEWKLLIWSWWFGWIPLMVTFITRISKNRTTLQIICAVMFLPALCALTLMLAKAGIQSSVMQLDVMQLDVMPVKAGIQSVLQTTTHTASWLLKYLILTVPLLICAGLWKSYKSDYALSGFISSKDLNTENNVYARPRRINYFAKNLLQGLAVIILLYLIFGLKILGICLMITAFLCLPWFLINALFSFDFSKRIPDKELCHASHERSE